ncbi:hypothetical protein BGW80DRAFT_1253135 [Lactifluus volemus]|nr:hypothetical protein BGW80DRAFT_1253135 [Lactifluus volemus]
MKELRPDKVMKALRRYDLLGPIARLCLQLTPVQLETYIFDRDIVITNASPDLISKCFSNSAQLSFDTLSHKICLIRRMRGSQPGEERYTIGFLSAAVEQKVIQKLEEFSDDQLLKMWAMVSRFGSREVASSIFEAFVHRHFRKRIVLDATPMVRLNRANSHWHASFSTKRPDAASVRGVAQQDFSLDIDVDRRFVYDPTITTATLNIQPGVYYVPRSGQQVALDSFILHGEYLDVFLCTAGHNHGIEDGLVIFLSSCSGLPRPTFWRFVFVVPDNLDSFFCPASSNSVVKETGLYTARIPMST